MTELLHPVDAPSDAELISRVRGGDLDAYGLLYERHVEAARRLSRQLVRGPDSEDLVSEAFAKVMTVLQGGGGPDIAFRAYLLTAVRRLHVDRVRAQSRLTTSDDMTPFDPGVPFQDTAVEQFESGAAAKAFASLPERWQLVLWHLEVEGQKPAEIAAILGMSPNSVSALAYRAREGLRQAFLSAHLADTAESNCRWVTEHLGAYVRHGLAKRDAAKVEDHLKDCRGCTAMFLELTEVNSNLAGDHRPAAAGLARRRVHRLGRRVGPRGRWCARRGRTGPRLRREQRRPGGRRHGRRDRRGRHRRRGHDQRRRGEPGRGSRRRASVVEQLGRVLGPGHLHREAESAQVRGARTAVGPALRDVHGSPGPGLHHAHGPAVGEPAGQHHRQPHRRTD